MHSSRRVPAQGAPTPRPCPDPHVHLHTWRAQSVNVCTRVGSGTRPTSSEEIPGFSRARIPSGRPVRMQDEGGGGTERGDQGCWSPGEGHVQTGRPPLPGGPPRLGTTQSPPHAQGGLTSVMMKKSSPGSPWTTIFSPSSNWTGSSASATVRRSHFSRDSAAGDTGAWGSRGPGGSGGQLPTPI